MPDDREILEIYNMEGRQEYAFNLIVRKYGERLYRLVRKMTSSHSQADDVLQDTFLKVWKYLPDFREESGLYTWMYRIAVNETITALRRERLRSAFSLSDKNGKAALTLAADPYFCGDDVQRRLYGAVAKLPPRQRAVFTLKYFEGLKYEEIAFVLGGTVGSLKASYHHAYTKICRSMEEDAV